MDVAFSGGHRDLRQGGNLLPTSKDLRLDDSESSIHGLGAAYEISDENLSLSKSVTNHSNGGIHPVKDSERVNLLLYGVSDLLDNGICVTI
jgi:hypothetical protein